MFLVAVQATEAKVPAPTMTPSSKSPNNTCRADGTWGVSRVAGRGTLIGGELACRTDSASLTHGVAGRRTHFGGKVVLRTHGAGLTRCVGGQQLSPAIELSAITAHPQAQLQTVQLSAFAMPQPAPQSASDIATPAALPQHLVVDESDVPPTSFRVPNEVASP